MGRFDKTRPYIVALDFDGTIKRSKEYNLNWETWEISPGFKEFYKWALFHDIVLALWTCRNLKSEEEFNAVKSFLLHEGISDICLQFVPGGHYNITTTDYNGTFWSTGSLKMYADFYVDDLAIGCPITSEGDVDWAVVRKSIEALMIS